MNAPPYTRLLRGWRRILFRFRRDRMSQELAEELEFHLEQKRADNRALGLAPQPALELARRQMGNLAIAQEDCRDMWSFLRWERLGQDLRHALRMYGRTPIFTAVCVLSMALGIGGNAAMFSLINSLLLRPLPYFEPSRLVRITGIYPRAAVPFFQERSRTMEIAAVSAGSEFNLTGHGPASRLFGSAASPDFLAILGVPVALGRSFRAGEEFPGRDRIVILSHALWKERFGASPSIVGQSIRLNGVDRQIVGVMPAGFSYPSARVQLWIPLRMDPSNFVEYWGTEFMPLLARLRPAASVDAARGEARALADQFRPRFPFPMPRDFNANSTTILLQQDIVGDSRGRLLILLCSVAAILLIACANVASLLLSRATTRRRELALRVALGAGRLRILRQLLTESVGLAILGGGLGIALGISALSIFKSLLPSSLPGLSQAAIDWPVAAAVTALAVLSGLASGLAPALSASQVDIASMIKSGGQRAATGLWTRLRSALVAGEVALTLVLLISAGLLLRSVYKLSTADAGFDPRNILTVEISPNQSSCVGREACIALYGRLLKRATTVSGVREGAVASSVPLDGRVSQIPVDVEDHPRTADFPSPMLWLNAISPSYLRLMRIPLLAGRDLTPSDGSAAAPVVIISEATAKRFWPLREAVGKHIKSTADNVWRTVVGVVGDVNYFTLSQPFPPGVAGIVYMPYAQSVDGNSQIPAAMTLLVKTAPGRARPARAIEQLAREQDPNVPVGRVRTLEDVVAGSYSEIRATMLLFLSFAGAAIALAAVGIYGLMSYWVSQRTYEIGLRVAVGCSRRQVLALILSHGMRLALYGVAAGILGALVATRFLAVLLFGVAPTDALTFAVVTALVLGVSAVATIVPAWRAAGIDPLTALRAE